MQAFCLGFFFFIFSQFTFGAAVLEKVDASFEGPNFIAELTFNKNVGKKDILVEYINQTIQLNIPGATVSSGKTLTRIEKQNIKSLYAYQYDKDTMRARIIYEKPVDVTQFEGLVKIDSAGNKVKIQISDPSVVASGGTQEQLLDEAVPPIDLDRELSKQVEDKMVSPVDIVQRELSLPKSPVDAKIKESSAHQPVFQTQKSSPVPEGSYWRMLISLVVVAVVGGGILIFVKWWSKNYKVNKETTKIQVLTQHYLGPKKSLAIIRVAGESILLGVTDHNISMIKTLSFIDDEIVENVPSSFERAMNTADVKISEDAEPEDELTTLKAQIRDKLGRMRSI